MSRLKAVKAALSVVWMQHPFVSGADRRCSLQTEAAAHRIGELLTKAQPAAEGIRVGVKRRGCNGLSYTMDYVPVGQKKKLDEVVEQHGMRAPPV